METDFFSVIFILLYFFSTPFSGMHVWAVRTISYAPV